MNNILITGGAGFIGSRVALKLIQKGYKIFLNKYMEKMLIFLILFKGK